MSEGWRTFYPGFCAEKPELTPELVELVQQSWREIEQCTAPGLQGKPDTYFTERFYEILFEKYPATKDLFKDRKSQARALAKMLSKAVDLLNKDLDTLVTQLTKLAERHNRYGTKPQHYGPVGECLVAAITEAFDGHFEGKVAEAWVHLYSTIVTVMLPVTYSMCEE